MAKLTMGKLMVIKLTMVTVIMEKLIVAKLTMGKLMVIKLTMAK